MSSMPTKHRSKAKMRGRRRRATEAVHSFTCQSAALIMKHGIAADMFDTPSAVVHGQLREGRQNGARRAELDGNGAVLSRGGVVVEPKAGSCARLAFCINEQISFQ